MKGEVRDPMMVWLLCLFTCGLYPIYFLYTVNTELKNYLGREDLNPIVELLIGWVCAPYAMIRLGKYVQEAQQRAGMTQAEDQGITFLIWLFICGLGWKKIQEELNKVWEGGGSAPATF